MVVGLALAAGAAGLAVGSRRFAARQLEQVDRSLAAARAQVELSQALLARQVEAVALLAARDPALLAALAPPAPPVPKARGRRPAKPAPRPDPAPLADAAVKAAAKAMGVDLSRGAVSALAGEASVRKDPAEALLRAAVAGSARQGHVRYGDTVYSASAAPVRPGTALLFGLPVDTQWTEALEAATSLRVVLFSGPGKPNASLPAGEAEVFAAAAARPGGAPSGLGQLGPVKPSAPGFLPPLPLLLVRAPAHRLQALPLAGLPGAALVLAAPTLPALAPLGAWQQLTLLALALLVLVAAVLTVLPGGGAARWPRELVGAADRIARGDFEARVPKLSGTAGKVGAALNRAAAAAAAARPAAEPAPEPAAALPLPVPEAGPPPSPVPAQAEDTRDFPSGLGGRASSVAPPPPPPAAPIPAASTTGRLDASELFGKPEAPAAPAGRTGTARFGAAETAPQAPAAAPAAAGPAPLTPESEEEHWQQVFQDFLKVREQCREPSEGLTYERFRQKLQKNKESLVQKYSCRAVRFQVYVKDGKTALKATPVR